MELFSCYNPLEAFTTETQLVAWASVSDRQRESGVTTMAIIITYIRVAPYVLRLSVFVYTIYSHSHPETDNIILFFQMVN